MFRKVMLSVMMLVTQNLIGQNAFGVELQAGTIAPLSKGRDPYARTYGGSHGPVCSIAAVWSDSASANTNVIFTAGYQYHTMDVERKEFGHGGTSHDSLRVRSGWLYLGLAPSWSLSPDKRTRLKVGANFLWPLRATATGFQERTSIVAPYYTNTALDDQTVPYGKFNIQLGIGIERSITLNALYAIQVGPSIGFGLLNESAMPFNVHTLQALLSARLLRIRASTPRSSTD